MNGSFIRSASEMLVLFLKSIPPRCSFNIIGFGSGYKTFMIVSVKCALQPGKPWQGCRARWNSPGWSWRNRVALSLAACLQSAIATWSSSSGVCSYWWICVQYQCLHSSSEEQCQIFKIIFYFSIDHGKRKGWEDEFFHGRLIKLLLHYNYHASSACWVCLPNTVTVVMYKLCYAYYTCMKNTCKSYPKLLFTFLSGVYLWHWLWSINCPGQRVG